MLFCFDFAGLSVWALQENNALELANQNLCYVNCKHKLWNTRFSNRLNTSISKNVNLLPELSSGGIRSNMTVPWGGSSLFFTRIAAIRSLNPKETFQTQSHCVLTTITFFIYTIVKIGKLLRRAINITESKNQAKFYVGRSSTEHIFCFVLVDYAWITKSQCFHWLVVWTHISTFCILPGFILLSMPTQIWSGF